MARLLMLIYEYPPIGAGAGVAAKSLAECWVRQGHQVCIVTGGKIMLDTREEADLPGLEVVRLPSWRRFKHQSNLLEMLDWGLQAYAWIRKQSIRDFDAVFTHFILPGGIPLLALKEPLPLPCIMLTHGHDIPGYDPASMRTYHRLTRPLMLHILKRVTRLCVLSPAMEKLAKKTFPESIHKISVIPNGMDLSHYRAEYLVEEPFKLLFVGRLVEQKDPFAFVALSRGLLNRGVSFKAEMYGDGPLMNDLRKHLKIYPLQNLMLHGFVTKDIIDRAMQHAHLYIHTSKHEAMSVSMLEAISKGLYVISTPVSGSELLDDIPGLGCRLESGSTEELIQKSLTFCRQYQGKHFRHKETSLQILSEQYHWDQIAKKYLKSINLD